MPLQNQQLTVPSRGGSDKMHMKCFDILQVFDTSHSSAPVITLKFYTFKVVVQDKFNVTLQFKESNCEDEGLTDSLKSFFDLS